MEEIEKRLIIPHPSDMAIRLANSIYFTSLQEGESFVYLSFAQLCKSLDNCEASDWFAKTVIMELLDELTEPVVIENIHVHGKMITWEAISLFTYTFCLEDGKDYIDIILNDVFIEVMKQYEKEPYINFQ